MKKYLKLLLLLLPVMFFSCQDKDVDPLFEESPEARTDAKIAEVKQALVENELGWLAFFQFDNYSNATYYNVIFKDNGRAVVQYYDAAEGLVKAQECGYTLRYTQQLDLVFTTASPFSDLTAYGGDFRFELKEAADGVYTFNTRNDREELGIGEMKLTKSATSDALAQLMKKAEIVVDDPAESFYRVLTIDGSPEVCLFKVPNIGKTSVMWKEGTSLKSSASMIEITDNGFALTEPFEFGGKAITGFVYNETDGIFEAMAGDQKVGTLEYGEKPFVFTGSMEAMLLASKNEWYAVRNYSTTLLRALSILKAYDPAFQMLQIYIGSQLNELDYYRVAEPKWIGYVMDWEFSEDGLKFNFLGTDDNGLAYYQQLGANYSFDMFMDEAFTVVPFEGKFYLVQDADPSIWAIAEPQ